MGKLISIEGIEGAGKSTIIQYVKGYLQQSAKEVVLTREPGGTVIAEQIRHLLLHSPDNEKMMAETELLLMFAARAQHMKNCILPALENGKWVITDRFIDASYAYQGGGRQVNLEHIHMLDKWIVGENYPKLTLLLDIDPEEGLKRADKRGKDKDRIEQEKIDFFARVRQAYLERAKQYPERIKLIDASHSLEVVEEQIREELKKFLVNEV